MEAWVSCTRQPQSQSQEVLGWFKTNTWGGLDDHSVLQCFHRGDLTLPTFENLPLNFILFCLTQSHQMEKLC